MKFHTFARNMHGYRPQFNLCSQGPFKIEICQENLIYSNIFACMNRAITLIQLKASQIGVSKTSETLYSGFIGLKAQNLGNLHP
jgi:hypothetical protein